MLPLAPTVTGPGTAVRRQYGLLAAGIAGRCRCHRLPFGSSGLACSNDRDSINTAASARPRGHARRHPDLPALPRSAGVYDGS